MWTRYTTHVGSVVNAMEVHRRHAPRGTRDAASATNWVTGCRSAGVIRGKIRGTIRGKIRGTIRGMIRGMRDGRTRIGDLGKDHSHARDSAITETEASRVSRKRPNRTASRKLPMRLSPYTSRQSRYTKTSIALIRRIIAMSCLSI